ncbi:hypothetical protein EON67_08685 [archaeon]|nr:MAG: hypothetical protein EON67_08685 [archaeon]
MQATGYTLPATATLQTLRILGVSGWNNGKVTVNGAAPNNVSYDPVNKFLLVSFNQPLMATLSVQWSG